MESGSKQLPDLETLGSVPPDTASMRPWQAVVVAGVGLALVVTIFMHSDGDTDPPMPVVPLRLAQWPQDASTTIDHASPIEVVATAAPRAHGAEQIEMCGIGWIDVKADGNVDDAALQSAPAFQSARRRLLEAMRVAPDEFSRAAASWLDPSDDGLVKRALSTTDPRVYALAFRACVNQPERGACAMLNAARWAQIDEGNASPWLFVLDEAARRKDEAAVADALFHIASARRFDDRYFASAGAIEARVGSLDIDTSAALVLSIETMGMAAAQSAPLPAVMQACRGAAIGDANRRQLCEGAAEAMAERSDSLILRQIGIGMGRRLGWREERVDAMAGEISAWMNADPSSAFDEQTSSCTGMKKLLRRFARQASIGEVDFMHEWAAKTGRSRESFAQAGRDARLRGEAAQAAAVREAAAAGLRTVASSSAPR